MTHLFGRICPGLVDVRFNDRRRFDADWPSRDSMFGVIGTAGRQDEN